MKNVQIIDGADNATFSVFQAKDDEFESIFPDGRDMELVEDLFIRLGEKKALEAVNPMWERPVLKRDALGIHGTLYYGWSNRRRYIPTSKREVDFSSLSVNAAQRRLFSARQA